MNPGRYFDHPATAWPLDPAVPAAIVRHLATAGGNPGRSAHLLATAAAAVLADARVALAALTGRRDPGRVVLTASTTDALALAFGALRPGDTVITTSIEHNAVTRPLARLADDIGVLVREVPATADGVVDPAALAAACDRATRLVVVTAGSNVLAAATDLAALRPAIGPNPLILVDAAQTVGHLPLAVDAWGLDLVALPGHKAIGGPQGTGALIVADRVDLPVLIEGGTGGASESRRTPPLFPEGFEAGTPNGPGIAGLVAALAARTPASMRAEAERLSALRAQLVDGLATLPGMQIFSCRDESRALPLVSFRIAGLDPADLAWRLSDLGFALRAGLHCAPAAHRTAGTLETGLVRAGLGPRHTPDDVAALVDAVRYAARQAS
jgi:selenocysteine lyase/cysteine desulfurase